MVHFQGFEYRSHTSCISEAQKYQGALYREPKKGNKQGKQGTVAQPGLSSIASPPQTKEVMRFPPGAYVEEVAEREDSQAVAVIDVPPRAPTPPPAAHSIEESVNVFDFLVEDATPKHVTIGAPDERKLLDSQAYAQESQYSQYSNGDGSQYMHHGFSYGDAPVNPGMERYDSWHNMADSQQSALMPPPVTTPAPKSDRKERKSDKKRKRQAVDDLDLSAAKRPGSRGNDSTVQASGGRMLHSGLTGGLSKLVTNPEFYEDRIDAGPTPISPLKRSKREKDLPRDSDKRSSRTVSSSTKAPSTSETSSRHRGETRSHHDDKHARRSQKQDSPSTSPERSRHSKPSTKTIDYPRPSSVQPTSQNALVSHYDTRAELFLSFITKGPDSERGLSINKALKRYHREVGGSSKGGSVAEDDGDKELWKGLRLRRNSRGEIVLFV
jgi:cell growth-regulating nucleolar protein